MTEGTVIVGAGPAGLAVAAALGRRGVDYTIVDRGDAIGASWSDRYDSLRLHTARWLSGLPGARIPRSTGRWVSRDDYVRYLQAYAAHFGIRPELRVEVQRIERDRMGWRILTPQGIRVARQVVVSTGHSRTPRLPDWPGLESFAGELLHSSIYREPSAFRDRTVLVVGAGNSAAEIAVEVAGVAAWVRMSVRTPPNIVRRDVFGVPSQLFGIAFKRLPPPILDPLTRVLRRLTVPDLQGAGLSAPPDGFSQFLRSRTVPILDHGFVDAVRDRRIVVVPDVASIAGPEVTLIDGTILRSDVIIAATGFTPDLVGMVGDLDILNSAGEPVVQGASTLPTAPGLYFVGISVELAGLLREIAAEARQVAEAIAATDRSSAPLDLN